MSGTSCQQDSPTWRLSWTQQLARLRIKLTAATSKKCCVHLGYLALGELWGSLRRAPAPICYRSLLSSVCVVGGGLLAWTGLLQPSQRRDLPCMILGSDLNYIYAIEHPWSTSEVVWTLWNRVFKIWALAKAMALGKAQLHKHRGKYFSIRSENLCKTTQCSRKDRYRECCRHCKAPLWLPCTSQLHKASLMIYLSSPEGKQP